MEAVETSVDSTGPSCPICYNILDETETEILACTHTICAKCYKKLVAPTCPLCRTPFPSVVRRLITDDNLLDNLLDAPPDIPDVNVSTAEWRRRRRTRRRGPRLPRNRPSGQQTTPTVEQRTPVQPPVQPPVQRRRMPFNDKKKQKKRARFSNNHYPSGK
jgi:hypothetical protein